MRLPVCAYERSEIRLANPNGMQHAHVLQPAFVAQPVNGRGADAKLLRDLANRQESRSFVW